MPRSAIPARNRRRKLTAMLDRGGSVTVAAAARRLGVSEMTIRRDLKALETSGRLVRCYGGAVATQQVSFEFAFEAHRREHQAAKSRIGVAAAAGVRDGWTVMLDTGTTTLQIARALAARGARCTVITSSLAIAGQLWGREGIELMLAGGRVRPGSPDLVGPATAAMIEQFTADVAFLGSDGIDPARGFFTADAEGAAVCRKMAAAARRVVVVADGSKLGDAGSTRFLKTPDADVLITNTGADASVLRCLRRKGLTVQCV